MFSGFIEYHTVDATIMSGVGGDSAVCGQIEHLGRVIFTACNDSVSIGTPCQIIDPVGVIGKSNHLLPGFTIKYTDRTIGSTGCEAGSCEIEFCGQAEVI